MTMQPAAGFSMIEVMVSMVVVSIGAMSMASLQMLSQGNVRESTQRLEATHLANGFLEHLRANNSIAALREYLAGAGVVGGGAKGKMPSPNCYGAAAACTPEELARFDVWLWEQLLDGATEQFQSGSRATNVGGVLHPTACLTGPAAGGGQAGNYTLVVAYRGTIAIAENLAIGCGHDAAFEDGTPLYGDNNEYRRTVLVQAYITPQAPK